MSLDDKNKQALVKVCHILDLNDEVPNFFEEHRIRNVRKLVTTTIDQLQELTKIAASSLSSPELDQITIFRHWYADLLRLKKRVFVKVG